MPISISMIVLGSQLVMPVADGVPEVRYRPELQKLAICRQRPLRLIVDEKTAPADERKAQGSSSEGQWSKIPRR